MDNNSILELKNISIAFDQEKILDSISMSFPRGKLITITGPSGCGKSTLLRIAAGLLYPDEGEVIIDGTNIFTVSRSAIFRSRKDSAFVFQDAALISNLSVYENIALPLRYHYTLSEKEIEKRVMKVLEEFDLKEEKDLLPARLSFGQKKLVSFARGLIMKPRLLFFDEPVSGIDAIAREKMIGKIIPLRDDPNITLIMVSHNLEFIKNFSDYIALLYKKKLFAYGARNEILKSGDPILQRILSIIVDEEVAVAEEVLGILTGSISKQL